MWIDLHISNIHLNLNKFTAERYFVIKLDSGEKIVLIIILQEIDMTLEEVEKRYGI